MKRRKGIDYEFCNAVMLSLFGTYDWLSDGTREVQGYATGLELCGIGIRILLHNGGKVIWRMTRQDAEFINDASLFAIKGN